MADPQLNRYGLHVAYNGSSFWGWQSQSSKNTVQDHLEKALTTLLRVPIRLMGATRTDSGVHAEQQVAVFQTNSEFDFNKVNLGLIALLPKEISVKKVFPVPAHFHPIRDCLGKTYRYRIWNSACQDPFFRDYCWQIPHRLDIELMRDGAGYLIGKRDFSSFCATDSNKKTRVREIFSIDIEHRGQLINFWVSGDGFLKQMIRNIVGTLVEIGEGKRVPEGMPAVLDAKDRKAAAATAPARGLCLVKVFYDQVLSKDQLIREAGEGFCISL